jgi:membrane protease YdiL (CAAX protease family)
MAKPRARALLSSEAPVPLPRMSPWARGGDALRFVLRPTPCLARHRWSLALALAVLTVFALDLAIDWAAFLLIEEWDASAEFLPDALEGEASFAEEAFYALLIAPLLEEAVYRGWLTGRVAALRFAVFGFAAEACFILSLWASEESARLLGILGAGIALVGFVQWVGTRDRDTAVPAWFTRHFPWLVWGSSLFFALIHLGNYEPLASPLGVLVVMPQLIGGLLLAYVRTRLGLRAAMLHHAAYNALVLVLDMSG